MQLAFVFFLLGSLYSFAIYPCVLFVLPKRKVAGVQSTASRLSITVIIAAHNEEQRIEEKIENTLTAISSLGNNWQCIVISDASNDHTDSIIRSFTSRGLEYVRQEQREGKEAAQLKGIARATGDIVFFTDVATNISKESINSAIECFNDSSVGAVSSQDRFDSNQGSGEGLYVQYEMALRQMESDRGGLIGLSGSFFAVRRELCTPWRTDIPSDFSAALNCYANGKVAIHCDGMIGEYKDLIDQTAEFQRKTRTVLRGMAALASASKLLSFRQNPKTAFQIWSHKIFRWATPWFLLGLFVCSAIFAPDSRVVFFLLLIQIAFYVIAAFGWIVPSLNKLLLIRIVSFFVKTNMAMAYAFIRYLLGTRVTVWEPSKR